MLSSEEKICSKCGSGKIALSQPERTDALMERFLGRKPYRCLSCYQRFWLPKTWFTGYVKIAVWVLACIAVTAVVSVIFWLSYTPGQPGSVSNDTDVAPVTQVNTSVEELPAPAQAVIKAPGLDADADLTSRLEDTSDSIAAAVRQAVIDDQRALAEFSEDDRALADKNNNMTFEDRFAADANELLNLAEKEVRLQVEQWRRVWQDGDAQAYLDNYSADFRPTNGQALDKWKAQRQVRITPNKELQITLDTVNVSFDPDVEVATVTFNQYYKSGTYADQIRKRLLFVRQQQAWKILSEIQLP